MKTIVNRVFVLLGLLIATTQLGMAQVCGCTDPMASNYNAKATINNGGCVYASTLVNARNLGTLDSFLEGSSTMIYWTNGYWTLNDHKDNCLYLLDSTNAATIDTLRIKKIKNYDIEEISQDSLYLYFGDIGNNNGQRRNLHILRINKKALLNKPYKVDTIRFSYEDQTSFKSQLQATDFDCEAFIVTKDSIYLFTKQWVSAQTTVYSIPKTPGTHIAHRRETFNVKGLITGATYIPEYQIVVLCGYNYDKKNIMSALRPFLYLLYDYKEGRFFSGNKRRLNFKSNVRAQVEAIATSNGLDYYITNEHFKTTFMGINIDIPARLQRIDLRKYLLPYINTRSKQ